MKQKEKTMIQALIDSFDWGVMVIADSHGQILMNKAFVQIFRIPDEVQDMMTYESQMSYIAGHLRDEAIFLSDMHAAESQPMIETQELLHTTDGQSLEVSSKPIALEQLVVGRIWHFRTFSDDESKAGTAFMIKKRQELLSMLIYQTTQKRSPQEILRNVVHQIGEVFAIDRAIIYQLDSKNPEGMRFHWSTEKYETRYLEYYQYLQNNPWLWNFYSQMQCIHVETPQDTARKISILLQQLHVKTCLSFPIIVQNNLWGVLLLHSCSAQRQWFAEEIEFLDLFSTQMAIAIHQYDLDRNLTQSQNQIKASNTTDELTLIPNAKKFEQVLEKEWQRMAREDLPLTVFMCQIDFFGLYQETYGEDLAKKCLQQVSWAIALVCQRPADLVARYSTEEFGVILPNTDLDGSLFIADQVLSSIQKLKINHIQSPVDQYISISIGINSMVPNLAVLPTDLVNSARLALKKATKLGGNRIILGEIMGALEI
ncbi:MAG: diguanylate cyclase [Limnothrix sp.]